MPPGDVSADPAADLDRAVGAALSRWRQWSAARWAAPAGAGIGAARADVVHRLVQQIADLAAQVEGLPSRPVPRLEVDLALPDQLAVVTHDLVTAARATGTAPHGAATEALDAALAAVAATRAALDDQRR